MTDRSTDHERTKKELTFKNMLLSAQMEESLDGILMTDGDGKIILFNRRFVDMWHISDEIIEYKFDDFALKAVHSLLVDPNFFINKIRYLHDHRNKHSSDEIRLMDGRTLDLYSSPMLAPDKKYCGRVWFFSDITDRKRAEDGVRRTNRTLKMISECNRMLIRARDEIELMNAVCRIAVKHGGYRLSWVGLAETDVSKSVRAVAQAGFENGYLETVNISWGDTEHGRGPTGTAIRTGRPVIARNILNDPTFAPWREAAVKRGYASSISIPITSRGQTFGAFMIYSSEPDAFDEPEVELLLELSEDMAYGLGALRTSTENKRIEKALRESELKHRILFDTANDAIVLMRGNILIDCNARTLTMFGCSREHIIGSSLLEYSPPIQPDGRRSDEKAKEKIDSTVKEGRQIFEWEQCRLDGTKFFSEVSFNRMEIGGEILLQAIIRDITARKNAEAQLRRLAAAIEQSGEAMCITDLKGVIQYVNPAFERVTGYTIEEAVGQTPRIIYSGIQSEEFYLKLWETISSGRTWEGRIVNKRKDGTLYTETAIISPVRDDSGQIVNYVSSKRDITGHLQLEAQLGQAQKMEAMGQLSGGVAHDFNNLLSVINGYSQLLLSDSTLKASFRTQIQEILRAGERASSLTRQLLVFSRRQTIEPRVIDLNMIVSDMNKMLRRLVRENIGIAIETTPNLWQIKADPGQIEQVIMNLVVNARDAILDHGKITVKTANVEMTGEIRSPAGMVPGPYVILSVADTGCGMDEKIKEHIFEPFFTTKEEGKGTGLGLATVYGIVKQSNGYIDIQSEIGKGATFKIFLPRHEVKDWQIQKERKEKTLVRGNETILLVDDEPSLLDMTTVMLESFGYRVLSAKTPDEAIRLAKEHTEKIHLLMTDVIMPEMNGRDLAKKMLTLYPKLKHLYISGYTDDIISQQGVLDEGMNFIQKPFSTKGLSEKVRNVLDGR